MRPDGRSPVRLTQPDFAQDPNELFDVVTASGEPTGVSKARAAVHREGDWHRAVHVWVTGVDEAGSFLTFQRRSLAKDTWPGRLDATVGGHVRAGEGIAETLREIDEEIGIAVDPAVLRPVGTRLCVHDSEAGVRDHELQTVFMLRDDRPLTAFRPNPAELAALVRFPLAALLDVLGGNARPVDGTSIPAGRDRIEPITIEPSDFIPSIDRYFYRVAIAAEGYLRGDLHISV